MKLRTLVKSIGTLGLGLSALFSSASNAYTLNVENMIATQEPSFAYVDRCPLDFDVPPIIVNGRMFVEVNALFRKLGMVPGWDQANQTVFATTPTGDNLRIPLGSNFITINGAQIGIDAPAFLALPFNRTMVPLSAVSVAAGAQVQWKGGMRTADITTNANDTTCELKEMDDMANFVFRGYFQMGERGPFSITNGRFYDGSTGFESTAYLVALAGTDFERAKEQGSANGVFNNILVGFYQTNNPFKSAVKNAIYNTVPVGSQLILSGHSQGGMVAQQIAADSDIKRDYRVTNTLGIGAPQVDLFQREGEVIRVGTHVDKVPQLTNGGLLVPNGTNWYGWGEYSAANVSNWFGRAHTESYRLDRIYNQLDINGHQYGSDQFRFNSSNVEYFTAPGLF